MTWPNSAEIASPWSPSDPASRTCSQPSSSEARRYESPNVLRIDIDRYRLLYEVHDATVTIAIVHAGRIP
jgi:mRNA interferase RelE/StbE